MSCSTWREDIVARLDRNLAGDRVRALRAHLASCPDCARFHHEHLKLGRILDAAAKVQLEPPARIWRRIESELAEREAPRSRAHALLGFFRLPRLGYGFAAVALMVLTATVAIRTRDAGVPADEILARLDAFHIQTSGNPFLTPTARQNPFFTVLERDEPNNPFQPGGGLK